MLLGLTSIRVSGEQQGWPIGGVDTQWKPSKAAVMPPGPGEQAAGWDPNGALQVVSAETSGRQPCFDPTKGL